MSVEPAFRYRAICASGAEERGTLRAESVEAARTVLAQRGLFPVHLDAETELSWSPGRRPSTADQALGLRSLATLLSAGLPLPRALAALVELAPESWRAGLPVLVQSVREGRTLAHAIESAPLGLSSVVVGLVAAGEAGGTLAASVERAATLLEDGAENRRAIRAALAYPLVLAGAGTLSTALLVGVVLPRFAAILTDLGQSLPASTRIVLTAADVMRVGMLPFLLAAITVSVLVRLWIQVPGGRLVWDRTLLRLPIVGKAGRSAAVARFASALGSLLESGVPLHAALNHAAGAAGNAALEAGIQQARSEVLAGRGLGVALLEAKAITPTAARLIRTGEESGRLGSMLREAGRIEADRAAQRVRAFVQFLEPALIFVFGAVVALLSAALLQAVYVVRP